MNADKIKTKSRNAGRKGKMRNALECDFVFLGDLGGNGFCSALIGG
jgi:hypothetical protein